MTKRFVFGELYDKVPVCEGQAGPAILGGTAALLEGDRDQLERQICQLAAVSHCVTVPGPRAGLELSLLAGGIEPGDRVLCSGLAPGFVVRAILAAAAVPLAVDVNPNTFNLDPFCLEYLLGKCRRTGQPHPKALIATDMFGLPCNYPALEEICRREGILLIEDMAQSPGADIGGVKTGSFGRFAVAAFWPDTSQPGAEEGGAVLCHSQRDADILRAFLEDKRKIQGGLPSTGELPRKWVDASCTKQWLTSCVDQLKERRAAWEFFREGLEGACRLQQVEEPYHSACTRFVAALPVPERREEILKELERHQVLCHGFWPEGETIADWDKTMLVHARQAWNKLIALPVSPCLSRNLVRQICEQILTLVVVKP